MDEQLNREIIIGNFSQRALEGKGLGPVLEMGQDHANTYRNYVTNRIVHRNLDLHRNHVVLDFGCGIGRVARHLSRFCRMVEAVDASAEMISYAEKNFNNPGNVRFGVVSDGVLKLADGSIDRIFTFWVMQHLNDNEVTRVLNEFKRVLKPGGKIVLFEQTLPVPIVYKDWSVHRTVEQYATLIKATGLKIASVKQVMRNPSRGMAIWLQLKNNVRWLLPLLYRLDNATVERKPAYVFYYTTAIEITG